MGKGCMSPLHFSHLGISSSTRTCASKIFLKKIQLSQLEIYNFFFRNGSMLLQIDCDIENGGMSLNDEFLVDFADEPGGPVLAHEIR